MFWRRHFSPTTSEENDGTLNGPMQLSNWLMPRRFRSAIIVCLILSFLGLLLVQYPGFDDRVKKLAHDATAPAPVNCNCPGVPDHSDELIDHSNGSSFRDSIQWSDFAYVQYVTSK